MTGPEPAQSFANDMPNPTLCQVRNVSFLRDINSNTSFPPNTQQPVHSAPDSWRLFFPGMNKDRLMSLRTRSRMLAWLWLGMISLKPVSILHSCVSRKAQMTNTCLKSFTSIRMSMVYMSRKLLNRRFRLIICWWRYVLIERLRELMGSWVMGSRPVLVRRSRVTNHSRLNIGVESRLRAWRFWNRVWRIGICKLRWVISICCTFWLLLGFSTRYVYVICLIEADLEGYPGVGLSSLDEWDGFGCIARTRYVADASIPAIWTIFACCCTWYGYWWTSRSLDLRLLYVYQRSRRYLRNVWITQTSLINFSPKQVY